MNQLNTSANISDPDGFYTDLLALHEGREKSESDAINARLILILANHIGDRKILREAFDLAVTASEVNHDRDASE